MFWRLVQLLLPILSPSWLERHRVRRARASKAVEPLKVDGIPRLLVDVTMIARNDVHTGIQRVVRSVMRQMTLEPRGWIITPVRYTAGRYRHTAWPLVDTEEGLAMSPRSGDVFLGLDLSFDAIRRQRGPFMRYRRAGMRFWFVVYDLLPIQAPRYFSAKVAVRFRWWLTATAMLADGYLCISPHVAEEVGSMLSRRYRVRDGVAVCVLPMGIDLLSDTARVATGAVPLQEVDTFVLAVGTIEPRKGYDVLIDAFERLWENGSDLTLVIVGGAGWKTDTLQRRIRQNKEYGARLRWLTTVDDQALLDLYDRARALVATSYGEGFGLPVLEALARSCPVLARDIPAFRVHASLGVRLFAANANGDEIARAISAIVQDSENIWRLGTPTALPTWRDTSEALQRSIPRE
ncbi:glycosyltransferase family 1 protein [Sphingomonas sp. RB3P16]|uniref:glycosyltransferase family 4 protein n=1 Tax=Parasphingomonas frigoris TaxID=3096163 RepID=UPI002FCB88FB